MKLTILTENISHRPELIQQFGLSALIAYRGKTILFDTGLDGAFAQNAALLGVDLGAVDLCIISHAHEDHAGGLWEFFAQNAHAPVYLTQEAKGGYYVSTGEGDFYAGVDQQLFLQHPGRFVFLTGDRELFPGCTLITNFDHPDSFGVEDPRLMMDTPQGLVRDTFAHELALVLEVEGGLCLVSGCSHNGIYNILRTVRQRFPQPIAAVIGGFHLAGPPAFSTLGTTREEILRLGRALLQETTGPICTCHCTGLPPYQILQEVMGDRLRYLDTGAQVELNS